ncbi:unnamed protein product, partial [Heterotrigona itama]
TGRRDSATQITSISPPNEPQESSTANQTRRRSSLTRLTDILREWSGGGSSGKSERNKLYRRETLADIAKSLPWSRQTTTDASHLERLRKRRESSVDSGIRSQASTKSRKDSTISELKNDIARLWGKKEISQPQPPPTVISPTYRGWSDSRGSRRGSGESGRTKSQGERKHMCSHHRRRQSQQSMDSGSGVMLMKYYRSDQRPSASSTDSATSNAVREHLETRNSMDKSERSSSIESKIPVTTSTESKTSTTTTTVLSTTSMITTTSTTLTASIVESKAVAECKNLTFDSSSIIPPTIVMSSVTPPSVSPTVGSNLPLPGTSTSGSSSPVGSPNVCTPTHPMLTTRRDSTTQVSCFEETVQEISVEIWNKEKKKKKKKERNKLKSEMIDSTAKNGRVGRVPTERNGRISI